MPLKRVCWFLLTQLPGQELPEGDLVVGLGCLRDAPGELGAQARAGKRGLEAEWALRGVLFTCLWLQGGKQGQRTNPGLPAATSHLSGFTRSSFYG